MGKSFSRSKGQRSKPCQSLGPLDPRQILTGTDSGRQAIQALGLAPFLDGSQPYSRSAQIQRVQCEGAGAPSADDPRVVRRWTSEAVDVCLLAGPGWTATFTRHLKSSALVQAEVLVTAASFELAGSVVDELIATYQQAPLSEHNTVPVGFWHLSGRGTPLRTQRPTLVPRWNEIRDNYTDSAAARIDRLVSLAPPSLPGTIVLMYGPPGTGKTTALRSLANAWQRWCSFEYIMDPEQLLASPDYLLHAAMPNKADDSRWNALILEDCDGLLRSDAKGTAGQHLARLLNLSDGMLGQGSQTVLVITTNEDVSRLHPAIVRPGRCMAHVEVGPLSLQEVRRWRAGAAASLCRPATLAQLYAHTTDTASLLQTNKIPELTGAYL